MNICRHILLHNIMLYLSYQIKIMCLITYKDLLKYVLGVLAIHSWQINCFKYVQVQQKHGLKVYICFKQKCGSNLLKNNIYLFKVDSRKCIVNSYLHVSQTNTHIYTKYIWKLFSCQKTGIINTSLNHWRM